MAKKVVVVKGKKEKGKEKFDPKAYFAKKKKK